MRKQRFANRLLNGFVRCLQVAINRSSALMKALGGNKPLLLSGCLSLYIASCYCLIVLGEVWVNARGYQIIDQRLTSISKAKSLTDKDKEVRRDVHEVPSVDPDVKVYECGGLLFSSRLPNIVSLLLPAIAIFAYVLAVTSLISRKGLWGSVRGFLVFIAFGATCLLAMNWANHLRGFRGESMLMLPAFFFAALFWFLDLFVDPQWFDARLSRVAHDLERLKLLYEFNKDTITIVLLIFVTLSVTLIWQVSSSIKEPYTTVGINGPLVEWIFALDVWGSLGLVGGIIGEIGRRFASIIDALAKTPANECSYETSK